MNARIKEQIEQINSGIVPEGYQKTAFGIFPCDWETNKTLGDLGQFSKGKGIPGNKLTSDGVPCVGYGDIYMKYNYHFENAQSFVDEQTAAESQKIGKGTLLFTATGETAEEIGKCVCYNGEKDIYAGGDIITFVPYVLNSLFIAYQQYQSYALRQKASFGQGHSVVHIQKDRLEKLHIAFPKSTQEQARIAEILMQWDKAIELQGKLGEAYQKLKKYCLNKMFPKKGSNVPEIRFPGFTAPWEQRKLGDIGRVAMNRRIFKEQTSAEGPVPFYKIGTFGGEPDAFISEELYLEYKEHFPYPKVGDILLSASGSIGKMVEYKGEKAYYQDSNIVWLDHDTSVSNTFLKCFYSVIKWAGLEGSTIKRLYNKNILETQITLPSYAEQVQIGDFFEHIDNLITLHQKKREKLVAQRKILQQYLLTGIVRV